MKVLLDRRLNRLVKFVTIDPSELHVVFKTKRAPQIHKLSSLTMSFKETPASLFNDDASRTGRQILFARNFCQFNSSGFLWMKQWFDIRKGRKNKKGWKANGGIFQSPISLSWSFCYCKHMTNTISWNSFFSLAGIVRNRDDVSYHSALAPPPTRCSALILMYLALSIFCFVVRNTSPMGWTIPDWISVWFDNL